MKSFFNKNSGFTLIELLVVIAIIGILAAVVMASVNSARKKGRDASRIKDLQEIRSAIELYIAQNGSAPDMGIPSCIDPNGWDNSCFANETNNVSNWDNLESQLNPYISKLSKDPCGLSCYGQDNTKYRGYFTYRYEAPAALSYVNDQTAGTITSDSYAIYAQNLEAISNKSFGFSPGSF